MSTFTIHFYLNFPPLKYIKKIYNCINLKHKDVFLIYSVTQSYANSFWGEVVLDTFNNIYRDGDNIWDQINIQQTCPDFYYDDL